MYCMINYHTTAESLSVDDSSSTLALAAARALSMQRRLSIILFCLSSALFSFTNSTLSTPDIVPRLPSSRCAIKKSLSSDIFIIFRAFTWAISKRLSNSDTNALSLDCCVADCLFLFFLRRIHLLKIQFYFTVLWFIIGILAFSQNLAISDIVALDEWRTVLRSSRW